MATGGSDKIKARVLEPRRLNEDEDFTSYNAWKTSLIYTLRKDQRFVRFVDGEVWKVISDEVNDQRGLSNDESTRSNPLSAATKVAHLQDFLAVFCQFVPHFLSAKIVNSSTGIDSIWKIIREYYSIQQSECSFMKYSTIRREPEERPMRLYYRLLSHINDSLLTKDSTLKYNDVEYGKNEVMSPTLERLVVLRWLELLEPGLPAMVQRYFSHELRTRTLKDLQPQICDALDDLLAQLNSNSVDSEASPSVNYISQRNSTKQKHKKTLYKNRSSGNQFYAKSKPKAKCMLCKKMNLQYYHPITDCPQLSVSEKGKMAEAFSIQVQINDDSSSESDHDL